MFIVEFSVVSADVASGPSGVPVLPYRQGELCSHVISVPPFATGTQQQAEEINAFLLAAVGCSKDEYEPHAQALTDAATGVDNVLEGRVVECSTVEKPKKTKPGEFFTYRTFTPHAYAPGEEPAPLATLLARKGAKAPQRPAAPVYPMTVNALPPPPPPTATVEPWATLPASYQRPGSAMHPKGEYWNGSAWLDK
jgi:hypothetical protein